MTPRMKKNLGWLLVGVLLTALGLGISFKAAENIQEELNAPSQAETTATDSVRRNAMSVTPLWDLFRPNPVKWEGVWTIVHRAANGSTIWKEIVHNALMDDGEQRVLEAYFRGGTPVGHYMGLSDATNPCSIVETDTLTTAMTGEPVGNGYSRVNVTRDATGWPTSALDSGDWRIVSKTCTYTSTGTIGPVNCAVLATTSDNTGNAVSFVALSQARTMANGESLDVSMAIKLQ